MGKDNNRGLDSLLPVRGLRPASPKPPDPPGSESKRAAPEGTGAIAIVWRVPGPPKPKLPAALVPCC
jgi:hypothetical protein